MPLPTQHSAFGVRSKIPPHAPPKPPPPPHASSNVPQTPEGTPPRGQNSATIPPPRHPPQGTQSGYAPVVRVPVATKAPPHSASLVSSISPTKQRGVGYAPRLSLPKSPTVQRPRRSVTEESALIAPPHETVLPPRRKQPVSSVAGCIVITNMQTKILKQTQSLSGLSTLDRLKNCVVQDVSLMLNHPSSLVSVESVGGHPLAIGLSIGLSEGMNRVGLIEKLQMLTTGSDNASGWLLPCLCKFYSENTGIFTQTARVDSSTTWFVSQPSSDPHMGLGFRVKRNPLHWMWGDQDGGEGSLGTVIDYDVSAGWAVVRWDRNNEANKYRWGPISGGYDLTVVESGVHKPSHSPSYSSSPTYSGGRSLSQSRSFSRSASVQKAPNPNAIQIGTRVRRNRHSWNQTEYGSPDGGDGGLGTIVKITGEGWTLGENGETQPDRSQYVSVRWDHTNAVSSTLYRWGANGVHDLVLASAPREASIPLEQPNGNEAVRCVQVTVLSSRGVQHAATRVQIAFDGESPEYTSVWKGENPAWGETVALDVPPGVSTDLSGRTLRLVLLGTDGEKMRPVGGCEVELGHLVGPTSQTLWVALDASLRSKLVASPTIAGRSLQTSPSDQASCWLRISIGFVFVQLQQRERFHTEPGMEVIRDAPIVDTIVPPQMPHAQHPHTTAVSQRFVTPTIIQQQYSATHLGRERELTSAPIMPQMPYSILAQPPVTHELSREESFVEMQRPMTPVVSTHHDFHKHIEAADTSAILSESLTFRVRELAAGGRMVSPRRNTTGTPQHQAILNSSTMPSPLRLPPAEPAAHRRIGVMTPIRGPADQRSNLKVTITDPSSPKQNSIFEANNFQNSDLQMHAAYKVRPERGPSVMAASGANLSPARSLSEANGVGVGVVPPPALGATSVVEYLVQLQFDPVTVLEVAKRLKQESVEDLATLMLLTEEDLAAVGVPLGCRRKICNAMQLLR